MKSKIWTEDSFHCSKYDLFLLKIWFITHFKRLFFTQPVLLLKTQNPNPVSKEAIKNVSTHSNDRVWGRSSLCWHGGRVSRQIVMRLERNPLVSRGPLHSSPKLGRARINSAIVFGVFSVRRERRKRSLFLLLLLPLLLLQGQRELGQRLSHGCSCFRKKVLTFLFSPQGRSLAQLEVGVFSFFFRVDVTRV